MYKYKTLTFYNIFSLNNWISIVFIKYVKYELHPAALLISAIDSPLTLALLVDAYVMEWEE